MKLKVKSYPHPVLGNKDDVLGAAFQTGLTARSDKQNYYFSIRCWCNNSTLQDLINADKAQYTVHIECTNTMHRRSYSFSMPNFDITVPADDLNGNVEINMFICASQAIENYQIVGAHEDYGNASFAINKGDILAIGDYFNFDAEKDYDSLKKISSLMQIERSNDKALRAMDVQYELPKIRIVLPQVDYDMYELHKSDLRLQNLLTSSIVLPVLSGAVRILSIKDDNEGYEDYRWYGWLKRQLEEIELEGERDYILAAQKILDYPLHRALEGVMIVEETDDDED